MRLSTFLIGAAAGAAAAMYMNRNNKTVMMGFSQLGENMSKVVDRAMLAMADKGKKTYREPETNQSLNKVQELVNQDPQVKSEVDQIMAESQVATH